MPAYHSTIEHTVQLTHEWVKQVDELVGWDDPNRSFRLMRSTLHALRDFLPIDEVAQLGAQLPLLIKGFYYDGWNPSATPVKHRNKADFIALFGKDFTTDPLGEPENAIGSVFKALNSRISRGEVEDVRGALREQVRNLWPDPA
jgi:uncharacterized protein (DUF2267 family)